MEDDGCSPNSISFNIIIQGSIRNNEIVMAMEFLREARDKGFSADSTTTKMIQNLLNVDSLDEKSKQAVHAGLGLNA
jgi:pentatricopeptide repeat protein